MKSSLFDAFTDTNCLVTGGLGFVGSNLVLALDDVGANVSVIDALIPTHGGDHRNIRSAKRPIDVIVADIADRGAIAGCVGRADFIFNLAGQVSHVDSMGDPYRDLELNAGSHLGFLEFLRQTNVEAPIVYTSTRQIYGRPKYLPVDERHPVQPVDVNGISKYAGEQFHILYANVHKLNASALRVTNVYGPRLRIRDDRQGFFGFFLRKAFDDQPITVFGDGQQRRDCLYVDDVVHAIASTALSPDVTGQVFNVGHPESLALLEIAEKIVDEVGSGSVQCVPWPHDREQIDIGDYFGDYALATRLIGWEPQYSFGEGILPTVAYYKQHLSWYL